MFKTFFPIILFSIVLPLIDIVTDLRMIIRLFSDIQTCIYYEDDKNVSAREWNTCTDSEDLSEFCLLYPNLCKYEKHNNSAILLLGEFVS